MSIIFPGGLPCTDRLGNEIYTDFRNMLRLESVIDDPEMSESEKAYYSLSLLYGEDIPDIQDALNELLWFYHCGEIPADTGLGVQLYDFEEDARYLYSGFLSAYRINLADGTLHLHWWEFISLFISLPEDTQMSKRMCDRAIDTSKLQGEQKEYYEQRKKAVALSKKRINTANLTQEQIEAATKEKYAKRFAQVNERFKGGSASGI